MTEKTIKLNLGCGYDYMVGWVNVDAVPEVKPDIVLDLLEEWIWADNSVDEVLLKDILEHFTWEDLQTVMEQLNRVTKRGATVTVRVPHIEQIITQFAHDPQVRNLFLYGATHGTGIFGAHKVGFTAQLLVTVFMFYGFELVSIESATTNWVATFKAAKRKSINRVGWCIQSSSWGGAEVYFSELIPQLQAQFGVSVVVSNNTQLRSSLYAQGVTVRKLHGFADVVADWKSLLKTIVYFPYTLGWYVFLAWRFRNMDLVVCATFSDKFFLTPFLYLFGVPVVWNEFGPVAPLLQKWGRVPELVYRLTAQLTQKIIVPSIHTKKHLSQSMHISLANIAHAPCGRSCAVLQSELDSGRLEYSKQLQDGLQSQTVVCVSRFDSGKGQLHLVEAFAEVVRQVPQARLVLVGEGTARTLVQERIMELGLTRSITMTGFVESVIPILASARVSVFPSQWDLEGFGLVAIESMALGKPVVAFNQAPMNEITVHDFTGLLVEPSVKNGLSDAIVRLLTDDVLTERVSKNARTTYRQHYQIKTVANTYATHLRWAYMQHQAQKIVAKYDTD